ncbi:carboxylesterase/lipase family protein [Streptomyces sp. SP18CS02]|uniref:carboxylesterase/lipase family protein n=1 Tax=Streptomyces sp. SP18CS02 TaxID=3002531 RepID=UPI002E768834|nr:carboxylesterase family protein [Streptomyces sp. SP18CS02]MEE1754642.1 carboxylesterase family protein [Streptomyces sp. SP18CS02]
MTITGTVLAETAYGTVAGVSHEGIAAFRGIPYAAPPLGENRFGAPVPPEPWDGVRDAFEFGPTAPKPVIEGRLGELMPDPVVAGDEWLNLNVWTPDPGAAGLPVMVWIHGGAFITGSSAVAAYDGATFARDGVICVTVNYRLGVEGFACLPDAPVPANRGLRDQIFALEWVRDNIARFGGDPDDVTVFGQSAGGMSVLTLLSLDLGLFRRAIVQSGTAHVAQSMGDAALVTRAVAARLDVEPTARALAGVGVEEIVKAQSEVCSDVRTHADAARYGRSTIAACGISFMPVIDGDLVTQRPIDAIAAGAGRDIPLLIGTNTEEFRLFVVPTSLLDRPGAMPFRTWTEVYGAAPEFWDTYARNTTASYPRRTPSGIACAVLSDRMFRIPTCRVAEARAGAPAPTYVYEFGRRPSVAPHTLRSELGACHGAEIPFVWDTLDSPDSRRLIGPHPPRELATVLHTTWREFARTGTAGWERYGPGTRAVMTYGHDNGPENLVVHDPRQEERALWEGVLD